MEKIIGSVEHTLSPELVSELKARDAETKKKQWAAFEKRLDAENKKELVIFRDSFGSSLAPLLAGSYSKITLVDIRYLNSESIGRFIEFSENCDVLFMYNTGTLNTTGQGAIS